jgi:hypothetical protein
MSACWKNGQTAGAISSSLTSSPFEVRKKQSRSSRRSFESRFSASVMRRSEPHQQCCQFRPVLVIQGYEFQTQPFAGFRVLHYGVSPNLTFLRQKMQSSENALGLPLGSLKEQSSHAHIANAGDIFAPMALPIHPYVSGRRNTRGQSPGGGVHGSRKRLTWDHGLTGKSPNRE